MIEISLRQLVFNWKLAKRRLDQYKKAEKSLRDLMVNRSKGEATLEAGTNTLPVSNSANLKVTEPRTYKVTDTPPYIALNNAIAEASRLDGAIAHSVIEWKPFIKPVEYEALSDSAKKFLDNVIEISYGAYQVRLNDPNKEFE